MVLRDQALACAAVVQSVLLASSLFAQSKNAECSVQTELKSSGATFRLYTKHGGDQIHDYPLVWNWAQCKRQVWYSLSTHRTASGQTQALPVTMLSVRQRRGFPQALHPHHRNPPNDRHWSTPLSATGHTAGFSFPCCRKVEQCAEKQCAEKRCAERQCAESTGSIQENGSPAVVLTLSVHGDRFPQSGTINGVKFT